MCSPLWCFLRQAHQVLNAANVYIGLLGFGLTLWGLRVTFKAARQARQNAVDATKMAFAAKEAADKAVLKLMRYTLVSDVSAASSLAEEIRRYQDQEDWNPLPDRYNELAKMYIRIKARHHLLVPSELSNMQSGVTSVRELAISLKESGATREPPDVVRFNKVIMSRIDDLPELSLRLGGADES